MVILPGSPPKLAILVFTHSNAALISSMLKLAECLYFSPYAEIEIAENVQAMIDRHDHHIAFLARFSPSYEGNSCDDPAVKPPPCIQNSTGRFFPSLIPESTHLRACNLRLCSPSCGQTKIHFHPGRLSLDPSGSNRPISHGTAHTGPWFWLLW